MNPEETKQRFEQWTRCKLNNPKRVKTSYKSAIRHFVPQSRSISIGDMVKDNSPLLELVDDVDNIGQEDEK